MGVRRTWHHDVADLATQRGISTAEARKAYKSGDRPLKVGEAQPAISSLPKGSLSDVVKACEAFTNASKAAGIDPQEVFSFVEKAAAK